MADQLKSLLPRPRLSTLPSIWTDHWVNYTSQSVYILLGDIVSVTLSWYLTYIWKNLSCTFLPSIYPSKWIHRIQSWQKRMCCIACMNSILRISFTQPKIDQVNAFSPVLAWLIWCLTDLRQAVTLLTIRQTSTDQQGLDTSHLWIDYHLSFIILSALLRPWLLWIKIWGLKSSPIASPLIVGNRSN